MTRRKAKKSTYKIPTLDLLQAWVEEFASQLEVGDVVLLDGDLGAGKTTTVNMISKHFGMEESSSPTYSLHNTYQNDQIKIDHFDLYRLENTYDLDASGLYDVFTEKDSVVFIEWASKMSKTALPLDWQVKKIKIELKNGLREIHFEE